MTEDSAKSAPVDGGASPLEHRGALTFKTFLRNCQTIGKRIAPWYYLAWAVNIGISVGVPLYKKQPWKAIPAYLTLAVVLGTFFTVLSRALIRIFGVSSRSGRRLDTAHDHLLEDYQRGDLTLLIMAQFALRAILSAFALASAIPVAFLQPASQLSQLSRAMLLLVTLYFFVSAFYFFQGKRKNDEALRNKNSRISGILWPPAVADWIIITLLSVATPSENHFHLAYIIPFLSAWLFTQIGRGEALYWMILIGISLKYIILSTVSVWSPDAAASVAPNLPTLLRLWLVGFVPKMLFWSAIAFPFALLKKLRAIETRKSQVLDVVTENIEYAVFRKNRNRRFEFANTFLLNGLGRQLQDVLTKTDEEIGIGDPAYKKSDEAVLSGSFEKWEGLEPNYDKTDGAPEMIWTTKKAIKDVNGRIVGLVGVCTTGEPIRTKIMYEKLWGVAPYYAVLKDKSGHIKWANPKFVKHDVGMASLKQLLDMNDGKGATDIDLYGQHLGAQYQTADRKVIADAESAIDKGDDPFAEPNTEDEIHFFLATKKYRWVKRTKMVWLDSDNKTIKGVQVYFHDCHRSVCLDGMIGRWLSKHLPRSLNHLAEVHSRDPAVAEGAAKRIPAEIRLAILEQQIMNWIRDLSAGRPIQPKPEPFELSALSWMDVLKSVYSEIGLEIDWPVEDHSKLTHDIHLIEAVILLLVMNAHDASIAHENGNAIPFDPYGTPRKTKSKVDVKLRADDKVLYLEVKDQGRGCSKEDEALIKKGTKLHMDGSPGSGLFLVGEIAEICKAKRTLHSPGVGLGSIATFTCPRTIPKRGEPHGSFGAE